MSIHPTPKQQASAYRSVWRLIHLIESGQVKGFDQETLDYLKEISLYSNKIIQTVDMKKYTSLRKV